MTKETFPAFAAVALAVLVLVFGGAHFGVPL